MFKLAFWTVSAVPFAIELFALFRLVIYKVGSVSEFVLSVRKHTLVAELAESSFPVLAKYCFIFCLEICGALVLFGVTCRVVLVSIISC